MSTRVFPGRSPFKTRDHPRWKPFPRMVTFQNPGPSTKGAYFPDGRLSKPGTIHTKGLFPGRSTIGMGREAKKTGTTAAQRPGAAATARPGCGELNPKGSPPRPAVAGASPRAFEGAFVGA